MNRLDARFAQLREQNRAAFVPFVTAGDPSIAVSAEILRGLPAAGADIIELGMAFTDPMADGPAIQEANLRALAAGITLRRTLELVRDFRKQDDATPIVLMGYFNPVDAYGVPAFVKDAKAAGVDGLIIVDLPPEEDADLCQPAAAAGLHFVRLATPTTDAARLPRVLESASGFVYYVSMTGITGSADVDGVAVGQAVAHLKRATSLPIAVGFGIKTPAQAAAVARAADAVVVGSAIVGQITACCLDDAAARSDCAAQVLAFTQTLSTAVATARQDKDKRTAIS